MRLIDGDAFVEDVDKIPEGGYLSPHDLISLINARPTIEERKKGKWLRYGEDGNPNEDDTVFWQCDQCLETYTGRTTRIPNYCPNCGSYNGGET